MAALTGPRVKTDSMGVNPRSAPQKGSTIIYQNALVCLDASGYLKPGVTGTGLIGVGRARTDLASSDNSAGNDGDKTAQWEEGIFLWENGSSSIAVGDEGKPCYMVDDQTVHLTDNGGARSPAGRVHKVVSTGVYVRSSEAIARQIAEEQADDKGVLPASTELTIAAGVVTVTGGNHTIDTEADAASDDLDTISGTVAGQLLWLRAENAARTVVLRHNIGNIRTPSGEHISLAESQDGVLCYSDGTNVLVFAASSLANDGGGLGKALATGAASKGANLVGIQDAGNRITATTVEGALQEIAAAGWLAADATGRARLAAGIFDVATVDDKFAAGAIGEDRLTANEVTGRVLANVADVPTTPGIPVVFPVAVADAATGNVDITLAAGMKIRVYDVVVYKTGGAGGAANTVQVFNGAAAISDAISTNIADKAVARAAEIDDAANEVAGGGTLRVTRTKAGGNAACQVHVLAYRIA